jgi:acyl-[acyl-carrier-protein]-phospholipid O-acyltransferase / long-chain-fatty-acid--[acyl-carrier-protein] ligase
MSPQSSRSLLRHRGFRALCSAQLLGAFNDNLFKMVVSLFAVDTASHGHTGGYLSLVGAVFLAPYLLFSGYAGRVADVFEKRRVLVVGKAGEIGIMLLALVALVVGRIELLLAVLFLLAAQATFFSPAKYGVLPEMLPAAALPRANGLLEMSRYVAVILGTALGGVVIAYWGSRSAIIGLLLVAVSAAGFIASLGISAVPRSGADSRFRLNPWSEIAEGLCRFAADRDLIPVVAGISYFEFLGALVLLDTILIAKQVMGADDGWTGLLGAFAGCGISVGAIAAGHLSRGRVEIGLVPFGAVGVALGVAALSATTASYAWTACVLLSMGFAGGFILVPLNAALQKQAGSAERGHLISTNNFLNMAAVLCASGALWLMRDVAGIEPGRILGVVGVATLAAIGFGLWCCPIYALSAFKWARSVGLARAASAAPAPALRAARVFSQGSGRPMKRFPTGESGVDGAHPAAPRVHDRTPDHPAISFVRLGRGVRP